MKKTYRNERLTQRMRASAGDELSLLVHLTRAEKIGTRMLLRNLVEIVSDDPELLVDVVLLLTDTKRNKRGEIGREEYLEAYRTVLNADGLRGASVLASAIEEGAKKAGFPHLTAPEGQAA
ncbi:hypothetical protein Rhal01_01960 [Rubritalea halochordaticola]|uniref:Uncharacterized protein n=1 Tax=Rubritalea halochordaticola TaxID=714537 RepID=A0ABP9UZB1_9BACT